MSTMPSTLTPTVITTVITKVNAETNCVLSFAGTMAGNKTLLYPSNVCNILVDNLLKPAIIRCIQHGRVTVMIQMTPTLFVDKSILTFDHVLFSEMPHPVDTNTRDLTPGAHVCVNYKMEGERYYGIVTHIEPIALGVHVQFEDGTEVKFSRATFSQKSKLKGDWYFVSPFVLMCHTYAAAEDYHKQCDADAELGDADAELGDADAELGDKNVPLDQTELFDIDPFDIDSFQFDESSIDEVINNSDIMDSIFFFFLDTIGHGEAT